MKKHAREMSWAVFRRHLLLLLFVTGFVLPTGSCAKTQPGKATRITQRIYLADKLDHRSGSRTDTDLPTLDLFEVGFDRRLSIRQAVPSSLVFSKVPSGDGRSLTLSLAAQTRQASTSTDAAVAIVTCGGRHGNEVELFRERVSPFSAEGDPHWIEHVVPLELCPGPFSNLKFTAEFDADSGDALYVIWGDPHITTDRVARIRPTRIVLLVSIDTLRSDRMELHGGPAATPNLMRLAKDGVVFDDAVAPSPWTIPSHASLFTSTYPHVHGTTAEQDIPRDLITVASQLSDAGWTTAGFVDTPWLGRFGFPRGFHHYDATPPPKPVPRWGVGLTKERLVQWVSEATDDNLFVFWHIMDVHGPYGTQAPFAGRLRQSVDPEKSSYPPISEFRSLGYHDYLELGRYRSVEDVIAAYDEGISRVDDAIGEVLDFLIAAGLYEDSTIVITSDHGESLFDHGIWIGHGLFLYEDEIHIPMILKLPDNRHANRRATEMVRLVDVAPTILDELGIPIPETFQGSSLIPLLENQPDAAPRVAFGTSSNTGAHYIRTQDNKYVTAWPLPRDVVIRRHLHPKGQPPFLANIENGEQLFNLEHDVSEDDNLVEEADWRHILSSFRKLARAASLLDSGMISSQKGRDSSPLSDEEIERLRALGYLIPNDSE